MSAPIPEPEPTSEDETHAAGSPASPPSERRREHSNEVKSARITAGAALIVAFIALMATAIGAIITASEGSATAKKQIDATNELALTNFIRAQRQTAYSAFLNDLHILRRTEADFVKIFKLGSRPKTSIVEGGKKQFDDAYAKLGQDVSAVYVVGSPQAADSAEKIEQIEIQVYPVISFAENQAVFNEPDAQLRDSVQDLELAIYNRGEDYLEVKFVQQARLDVGNK